MKGQHLTFKQVCSLNFSAV